MFLSLEFPYNFFFLLPFLLFLFAIAVVGLLFSLPFSMESPSPCRSIFKQEDDNQVDPTRLIDDNEELVQILDTPPARRSIPFPFYPFKRIYLIQHFGAAVGKEERWMMPEFKMAIDSSDFWRFGFFLNLQKSQNGRRRKGQTLSSFITTTSKEFGLLLLCVL